MTPVDVAPVALRHPWITGRRLALIGFVGLIAVPLLLILSSTSWSSPDGAAYIRMAFASVSAATIASLTAIGLLVLAIARRSPRLITATAIVAFWVVANGLATFGREADRLLAVLN